MQLKRIKLIIEYDGTGYSGWQFQPNKQTIQGDLESALHTFFKQAIRLNGSGRTDSGVHARAQIAHCDIPIDTDLTRLRSSLNGLTDQAITVKELNWIHTEFNSRFDATARRYRYYITENPISIGRQYSLLVHRHLDLDYLNKLSRIILGDHDFESFAKKHSGVEHYRCIIHSAQWFRENDFIIFEIKAIRFLRGMVRALVGTFMEFEKTKKPVTLLNEILNAKDRKQAGVNAPSTGLVLEEIYYGNESVPDSVLKD